MPNYSLKYFINSYVRISIEYRHIASYYTFEMFSLLNPQSRIKFSKPQVHSEKLAPRQKICYTVLVRKLNAKRKYDI